MKRFLLSLMIGGTFCSVMAAVDHEFYSTIATGAWWMRSERFYADTAFSNDTANAGKKIKDSLPINSVNFLPYGTLGYKVSKGPFRGCIEMGVVYGVYDFVISGNPTYQYLGQKKTFLVYAKSWYATWLANDYMTFLLGRDFTPANFFPSNQAFWKENSFNNIGCMYTGRSPMFQLTMSSGGKAVEGKIALVQPDTTSIWILGRESAINSEQNRYFTETNMPKYEGSFGVTLDAGSLAFNAMLAGGYQAFTNVLITENPDLSAANSKHPIESWVGGLDLGVRFFNRLSLSCDMFYGKNVAVYSVAVGNSFNWWKISNFLLPYGPQLTYNLPDDPPEIVVVRNGYIGEIALIVNAALKENVSLEAGAGTIGGRHDYSEYISKWNPAFAWYFQSSFDVLGSLKIVPEVGQYIWGPHKGFGRTTYVGLNTKVDFN
ncbi:MAG: hypothetical protein JXA71_00460 [Chitinispirillaceae bacterium]|nr:hypothetical protein [Chitinispirillaceae bacterium]